LSIFAIASGKGGVGKSCIAAYTAAALAATGKRVLLSEPRFGFRSLDLIIGVQDDILFDFSDVIEVRCEIPKAIVKTSSWKNLYLLPGPPAPLLQPLEWGQLEWLLQLLQQEYDIVIADGINFGYVSPEIFHTIMLVVTPESLSVRSAAMHNVTLNAPEQVRLIINNVPARIMPIHSVRDFDDIIDIVGARLLGVIPHSPSLQYASNNAIALNDGSLTLEVFDNIAARLMGQSRKLLVR